MAAVSLSLALGSAEEPARSKIRVIAADRYFSVDAIGALLSEKLRPDTRTRITSGPDVFWSYTNHSLLETGYNYCFAIVGLTENPTEGRSPRIPEQWYSHWVRSNVRGRLADSVITQCRTAALMGAVEAFASSPLNAQLSGIERTREKGAYGKAISASDSSVYMVTSGLSPESRKILMDSVPREFRRAFDFRKVSIDVGTDGTRFPTTEPGAGELSVCAAWVGVSARPPENRNYRFPASWDYVVIQLDKGESSLKESDQHCRLEAAGKALKDALSDSWDRKGLLAGIETTREDGLNLPGDFAKENKGGGVKKVNTKP